MRRISIIKEWGMNFTDPSEGLGLAVCHAGLQETPEP